MPKKPIYLIIMSFFGYSLLLSIKDVGYRYLLSRGMPIPVLLACSGAGCLLAGLLVAGTARHSVWPKDLKPQLIRVVINMGVWFSTASAFLSLHATSVSILSKAYLPVLILLAPLLGTKYQGRQLVLAVAAFLSMLFFVVVARAPDEPLVGYLWLMLAVALLIVEFILLKNTTTRETPFVVAAAPAIACLLFGTGAGLVKGVTWTANPSTIITALVIGFVIYGAYFVSIYRYQILPLGLSEYPALFTAFFILPAEYILFGFRPERLYLASFVVTISLVGGILWLNMQKARAAAQQ